MALGSRRRRRITEAFAELCDAIGNALGAAQGRRDAAVQAHAEAMVEVWLREDGLDAAAEDPGLRRLLSNPRLRPVLAAVEADRDAAFTSWLEHGPASLRALLAESAPGAAGAPRAEWPGPVGTVESDGPVPSLWYIGDGRTGPRPGDDFPVAVPLLDDSHLQITSTADGRAAAEDLVQNLLLRVISYFRPGLVRLHVWDVGSVSGTLPGLYPLTRNGLLTVHDPTQLSALLEELSDRIRQVHTRVLVDGHPSLRALAAERARDRKDARRAEPWVIAVLIGNRSALREEDQRALQRVARGGVACGVHLVLLDVPVTANAAIETIRVADDGSAQSSMTGPYVRIRPEPAGEPRSVTDASHAIATGYDDWRSRVGSFEDLMPGPGHWGEEDSTTGLTAPIGFREGDKRKDIELGDTSPHALIGGPSGSGKTNLLLTMISTLAARYSPKEIEFYLLDFKEGVSFAQFAPIGRTSWLPHARLVGVNVNTDREFGLALLQFLSDTMRRRAALAKAAGVTKLEELRRGKGEDHGLPRIVAVIDEFQYLFAETDSVSKAAAVLLEDVARRGRSQGIHLVLASQDVSGIEAFWGRPAIFEQFVLRIGLPRARRVLVDTNDGAVGIPRWHAVVNHESGTKYDNIVTRIPNASATGEMDRVLQRLREENPDWFTKQPILFDGNSSPAIKDLMETFDVGDDGVPQAVVGQRIDVDRRAATVRLSPTPGRNLAVLASTGKDAVAVLGAAAGSLAAQYPSTELDVIIAPLVAEAADTAEWVAKQFVHAEHNPKKIVGPEDVLDTITTLADTVAARLTKGPGSPTLLVLFAADAAESTLGRGGTEALRRLLRSGPETGVHVLGWWRSSQRLRALLTMGASVDDLGAWVALDVHGGTELGPLVPGMQVSWAPRPGRGLFFDRAQHAQPEVIIVPALGA